MKVNNIEYKLKNSISTMVICGSYMFEFSVSKDMKKLKISPNLFVSLLELTTLKKIFGV